MKTLTERVKKYWKSASWFKKTTDLLFYSLIVLLLIPATRAPISTFIIKATMRKPRVIEKEIAPKLSSSDYRMGFSDFEGNTSLVEDFKGEVILLNFWATWCPPCRAEMPSLQALYEDYGDKVKFILISNEDQSVVKKYLIENQYSLPSYTPFGQASESFRVNSIPATFLISRNGSIVSSKTGAANWNSDAFRAQLDMLLSETYIDETE